MYQSYSFVFADQSSEDYGMFVCDIGGNKHGDNEFGNRANIVEARIANRITPLHYGVRYHDEPLRFNLIFASEEYMDRYEIQQVSKWLTGYQDYQWLSVEQPDMEHIQFKCLIETLTPISIQWFPIAFEAEIVCDCPYGYSYPYKTVIDTVKTKEFRFYNDSTIRELYRPDVNIELENGCTNFKITNRTTGSVVEFNGLPQGITIVMNNEDEIVSDSNGTYNLYDFFNFGFLEMQSGDNQLLFEGDGKVTISGRFLYNVGA